MSNKNPAKKPQMHEVQEMKETLKRWHANAQNRGKMSAMHQIKKLYGMIEYWEENTDFNIH